MPVLAINSKDGQDLVIASNKKVVVAITSPYLAQCNDVEKEIEELSEMYRDIVFASADHGEFHPQGRRRRELYGPLGHYVQGGEEDR